MIKGFFSKERDLRLPHPPLDIRILMTVEAAIRYAWDTLKKNDDVKMELADAHEKDITMHLFRCLEELRKESIIPGFGSKDFETVIREGNLSNYNGEKPDKEPDLVFRLCGIRPGTSHYSEQDGIITECKPVDINHSVGSCYCKKGLIRFVNGDYAWAMQTAFMVAYVRGKYAINSKLHSYLKENPEDYNTTQLPQQCKKSAKLKPSVYISRHNRLFLYENGQKAGEISIRHLWLKIQ